MKKEKFIKRFYTSKLFLLLGFLILGLMIFSVGKKIVEGHQIEQEIKNMEKEIAALEVKNTKLNELLNYLNTEEFIEQEARLKFNLRKPGESVAILPEVELQQENKNNQLVAGESGIAMSNPQKWWNYFFKK